MAPSQAPTATLLHTATELSQLQPLGPVCPHPVEAQQHQAEKARLGDGKAGWRGGGCHPCGISWCPEEC